MKTYKTTKKQRNRRGRYKSILENDVATALEGLGIKFGYETIKMSYIIPTERHSYTPDFIPDDVEVIIEVKGRLTLADRKKMLLLKEQYPDKTFILVFGNANNKLYKGSKTSYKEWSEKHGFKYVDFYKKGLKKEDVIL